MNDELIFSTDFKFVTNLRLHLCNIEIFAFEISRFLHFHDFLLTIPNSAISIMPSSLQNIDLEPYAVVLLNKDQVYPLHKRFRALFALKGVKSPESIDILAKAFVDDSVLLKHEVAYVMGQIKLPYAIPHLSVVLENTNEDPMVRHEAAEALGAIVDASAIQVLEKYAQDPERAVRETCEIALDRIRYEQAHSNENVHSGGYASVDPAPALKESKSTQELGEILMNTSLPLFERYRAMFSLRNRGDVESVLALAKGFGDESALFRHEVAYVFGQLQHPASVPALSTVLQNTMEEPMVRHEAAEALGSIATDECMLLLEKFSKDSSMDTRVVTESCQVGMDMYEFEQSGGFQYAGLNW